MTRTLGFAILAAAALSGFAIPASASGWSQCGRHCAQFQGFGGDVRSFEIRPLKGQPLAIATVTDAADLPFGLTWQIDGGRQIRVPFMHCGGGSCSDQLVINDAYLDSLRQGSALRLGIHQGSGWKVSAIRLAGFGPAYDGR